MEFGLVHVWHTCPQPSPGFNLFMFAAFLIFVIRSVRKEPFLTFGTIVAGTNHGSFRKPTFRHLRKFFSPVHLHALESQIRCAYCRDLIAGLNESQRCPDCRTLHHTECFDDGGCAIFGCTFSQHRL